MNAVTPSRLGQISVILCTIADVSFLLGTVACNTTCFSIIHAMNMETLMWKTRVVLRTMFPGRSPCVSPQLTHVPTKAVIPITNMRTSIKLWTMAVYSEAFVCDSLTHDWGSKHTCTSSRILLQSRKVSGTALFRAI